MLTLPGRWSLPINDESLRSIFKHIAPASARNDPERLWAGILGCCIVSVVCKCIAVVAHDLLSLRNPFVSVHINPWSNHAIRKVVVMHKNPVYALIYTRLIEHETKGGLVVWVKDRRTRAAHRDLEIYHFASSQRHAIVACDLLGPDHAVPFVVGVHRPNQAADQGPPGQVSSGHHSLALARDVH